jgi:hypothetical protein
LWTGGGGGDNVVVVVVDRWWWWWWRRRRWWWWWWWLWRCFEVAVGDCSHLEQHVQSKESARGVDGEHLGVLVCHDLCLRHLSRLGLLVWVVHVADRHGAPDVDGNDGHHNQHEVRKRQSWVELIGCRLELALRTRHVQSSSVARNNKQGQ